MILHFVIIIIIVRYLRTTFETQEFFPEWDTKLVWANYAAITLLILGIVVTPTQSVLEWIGQLALLAFAWALYKQPFLKPARMLLVALAPYIIATFLYNLLKIISNKYHHEWSDFFESAIAFTVIWIVGVWLVVRNQNKELNKVRKQAAEEEKNNKIVTAMKAKLEVEVAERTAELTKQKEELEQTLHELKATQAQLIQSEKMASLGELTAGIAHEIQNPLNFVNNFSEVSVELLQEMKEEIKAGNAAEVIALADDLGGNLEKITFHGKRADSIVKGMLQHSRKNTGQLEPTNINALADEYFRLSYHGLRAKDKNFNAVMQTQFDETLGNILIVPQDIGRVLLNLFNNAFYAVTDKKKTEGDAFKPAVLVSTQRFDDYAEIRVKDNGNGIPQNIVEKIFQPFFSTKPTGHGTGLGLSMSYDIVTKQHGGSIKAVSEEGKGTTMILQLPLKRNAS